MKCSIVSDTHGYPESSWIRNFQIDCALQWHDQSPVFMTGQGLYCLKRERYIGQGTSGFIGLYARSSSQDLFDGHVNNLRQWEPVLSSMY